jgi:hypothetical protein
MSGAAPQPRQALVASWVAQMVGTVVIAVVVLAFVKGIGSPLSTGSYDFQRYMMGGILVAALPALGYLRVFKPLLLADEAALKARGVPDPAARKALLRALSIGGALCELPMALGVIHLFMGGDTRWFVYATLITIVVRLSYRPFTKLPGTR